MEKVKKNTNWLQFVSLALIVLLSVEVFLLAKQNRELKATLNPPSPEILKAGDRVEPIKIQTLDGTLTTLKYEDSSKKNLLFVLSTTCPHCEKNLPIWASIVAKNNNERCVIIGLSVHPLDATRKFVVAKNVGFYIATTTPDTSFSGKYKVSGVPETILLDGGGIVEKAWVGELTPEQTMEIQTLMNNGILSTN